jgi:hypothetical protein
VGFGVVERVGCGIWEAIEIARNFSVEIEHSALSFLDGSRASFAGGNYAGRSPCRFNPHAKPFIGYYARRSYQLVNITSLSSPVADEQLSERLRLAGTALVKYCFDAATDDRFLGVHDDESHWLVLQLHRRPNHLVFLCQTWSSFCFGSLVHSLAEE